MSFGGLVDAFGGIDVEFAHPAFDLGSGLDVQAGRPWSTSTATQALAFVRSRHYTEVIDGQNVPQGGLPDVNRTGSASRSSCARSWRRPATSGTPSP